MSKKDLKAEILRKYKDSSLIVDLRSLVKEKDSSKDLEKPKAKKILQAKINFKFKKDQSDFFGAKIFSQSFNKKLEPNLADKKKFKLFKGAWKVFAKINSQFKKYITRKQEKKIFFKILKKRQEILSNRVKDFFILPEISISFKKKAKPRKMRFISRLPKFALILLFLVIPLKAFSLMGILDFKSFEARIFNNSYQGINNLLAAADSLSNFDLKNADADLTAAGLNFLAADDDLGKINDAIFALASLSSDPKIKLASQSRKFLAAGFIASSLGKNLLAATDSLFSGSDNFKKSLEEFIRYSSLAVKDAKELEKIIAQIDEESLPEDYYLKFIQLKNQSALLTDNLDKFLELSDSLRDLLGLSMDKRYLLVFQNNSELRASGGFLGSYALVDLRDGKIRNLEVPAGGSYDLEAGLQGKKFASPYALHLVNPLWNFWDANWWPDWPKTAKHLMWFYEQSGGPSVDGVISLTPTVVEKMLEITGPIDMTAEYGLIIDAENFWETVQKVVEYKQLKISHPEDVTALPATSSPISVDLPLFQDLENNSDNKPKKIIGDLMAKILEVLPTKLSRENLAQVISMLEESVTEKQVMLYFKDEDLQQEASHYYLSGEIKQTDNDYLMIVDTNIAGQKTDRVIEKKVSLESKINDDGQIINTLTIVREHQGQKNAPLTGVRNVNWLRIYVPQGATLLRASGFEAPAEEYFDERDPEALILPELEDEYLAELDELSGTLIYDENDKTVFANWTMTDPGQRSELSITYRLPYNFNHLSQANKNSWLEKFYHLLNPEENLIFPYSLLWQKQPGAKAFNFNFRLNLPKNYEFFWQAEEISDFDQGDNNLQYIELDSALSQDRFYGVLIKKNQE
ncbi:DUF4012 domain-containing protein [Patescibacteria group bacterium]|nr:DUF4012 domain-containing protein [Patescibacteria group bacterium]